MGPRVTKPALLVITTEMKNSAIRLELVAVLALILVSSCARTIGWGVVLWPPEGSSLGWGQAVPIYFRSNITKTYAIGVPDSDVKEELELWRLQMLKNKKEARARALDYAPLAAKFGIVARDGLILRSEPSNIAEQVYRLKLDENIKLLELSEGAEVVTGDEELPGDWYLALSSDGTRGYVYSNQLILWDASTESRPSLATGIPVGSSLEAALLERIWRPDYFIRMVDQGHVDLGTYKQRFGIFTDAVHRQIRVERPEFSKVYDYDSIERRGDGSLALVPSGALFSFTAAGDLLFTPPQGDLRQEERLAAEADGQLKSYVFVQQREDPRDVIATEERRRLTLLGELVTGGELFESQEAGSLVITRSSRFTWAGYGALAPSIIPEGAGQTGSISVDLFLDPQLAVSWRGALTIRFDGTDLPAVSFAYRYGSDYLELAWIDPSLIKGATVSAPDDLSVTASLSRYR